MSNENTKQQGAEAGTEQHPALGMFGYGIGGILGLLILVGLASILEGDKGAGKVVEELPHAAVLVAFDDLHDAGTREALAEMQRELAATGLAVIGPLNYPILIPGDFGVQPTARQIDRITPEELDQALPYFEVGKWLMPRIYAPDLRETVIRLAPPGRGQFPSGSRLKVESILEKYRARFREVLIYSRALGLEDETARARINLTFGVQSANILVVASEEGFLSEGAIVSQVYGAVQGLTDQAMRSSVSTGSYVAYAWCVQNQSMTAGIGNQTPVKEIIDQGRAWNVPLLIDKSGKQAWIEVYTEAEGAANAELCYFLAANYPHVDGLNYKVTRRRPIRLD